MKKAIAWLVFFGVILLFVGVVNAVYGDDCKNYYWFDNDNKECGQKEFCGTYMYEGLQTFDTMGECQRALNSSGRVCAKEREKCEGPEGKDCCAGLECQYDYIEADAWATCVKKDVIVCAQEAKQCPDGSYVSRNASKNCKFDECKTYGKNVTFVPWQKRNESECVEGCKCVGAVMSCPTENGKIMTITAGRSGNIITITVDRTEVNTTLEVEIENDTNNGTKLKTRLSNGRKAEIKIMPDTASLRARERLGELGFNITLKEVGGEAVYEFDGKKEGKIFGLFRARGKVMALVNAESGEIEKINRSWWAFLARGI